MATKDQERRIRIASKSGSGGLPASSNSHAKQKRKSGRRREKKVVFGVRFKTSDALPRTSYSAHHHMSDGQRHRLNLSSWLAESRGDPAVKVRTTAWS